MNALSLEPPIRNGLKACGYKDAHSVRDGMLAWAIKIDGHLPAY
jgi:hypothetical protein